MIIKSPIGIHLAANRNELSHVSVQAHAAYLDATRRLLMEQQHQHNMQLTPQRAAVAAPCATKEATPPTPATNTELEGLAEMLKQELATSLATLIDATLSRYAAQRRSVVTSTQPATGKSDDSELSKLQRSGRVIDRGLRNGDLAALGLSPALLRNGGAYFPQTSPMLTGAYSAQRCYSSEDDVADVTDAGEQDEALSLVVSPKKRRSAKTVTPPTQDFKEAPPASRLSPLEISLVNHSSSAVSPPPSRTPSPAQQQQQQQQQQRYITTPMITQHQPASVAPPGGAQLLHHPSLFSNYSAYFAAAAAAAAASQRSKTPEMEALHPALLAGHSSLRHHHVGGHHVGGHHGLHQLHHQAHHEALINDRQSESSDGAYDVSSGMGGGHQSSTLTPMHLRKAKLMFFWCRYPSSSVLKTFFPDVKFNKNNTAQLVKWFSNFRSVLH